MKKTISALAAFAFALSISGAVSAHAAGAVKDFSGSDEYHLVTCQSATELDCVESFGFLDSKGTYVPAEATTTPVTEMVGQNGNRVHMQFTDWTAKVDGATKTARLDVPLQSPKYVIFPNGDGTPHYGASLRPWVDSNDLLNTRVRFKIRTSYLIPQNVQLVAEESDFSQTKIAGGNLWLFEGKGTPVSNYTSNYQAPDHNDFSAKADMDTSTLHFIIHHGDTDLSRGYWPAVCGDKGYTVQAFNSNSAGSPSWNSQTDSLDFAIVSPHTKADGSPNIGFFKLWTSDEYVNCKWPGNKLTSSPKLEVRIVSEDGVTQTSTNLVTHKDGKIFVSASGFHYSKPIIKLVPVEESGTSKPVVKPAPKSITCIKGKTVKKVNGAAPKCPSGYKLKK
jgi:hypothetical protein